ncbi:MAG: hypothetical protein BM556_16675 [Bacteriovorax sp. MedPE-SWde]|nr:MAG: hypothetical protein BM556_16675 [Bacteriovorax sp. MedPE-SWde]
MKKNGDFKTIHNNVQKEALVNEIKGNLFEYLVAHCVAREKNVEAKFLERFSGGMKDMFSRYESWLRENDRDLIHKLPLLAQAMATKLCEKIPQDISEVLVIGKMSGGFHNDLYKEADILLLTDKEVPISLKLCKKNAFVNTKSGGAKSFIGKYFESFEDAALLQETYSNIIDDGFQKMGEELYALHDLEFCGRFDSLWEGPDLPGELNDVEKEILHKFYRSLNYHLYNILKDLHSKDKVTFVKSLMPIIGQGDHRVIQAICFHKDIVKNGNKSRYESDKVLVKSFEEYCSNIEFLEFNELISSFEIKMGEDILQIRIKPMNKFTTASYKINCSMRYGE